MITVRWYFKRLKSVSAFHKVKFRLWLNAEWLLEDQSVNDALKVSVACSDFLKV